MSLKSLARLVLSLLIAAILIFGVCWLVRHAYSGVEDFEKGFKTPVLR